MRAVFFSWRRLLGTTLDTVLPSLRGVVFLSFYTRHGSGVKRIGTCRAPEFILPRIGKAGLACVVAACRPPIPDPSLGLRRRFWKRLARPDSPPPVVARGCVGTQNTGARARRCCEPWTPAPLLLSKCACAFAPVDIFCEQGLAADCDRRVLFFVMRSQAIYSSCFQSPQGPQELRLAAFLPL